MYEDAIAKGNAAAVLKQFEKEKDLLQLDVGNILPDQKVEVKISLLQPNKIFNGAY
jgi:hypothetical protein